MLLFGYLENKAPSLASMVKAITLHMMEHYTYSVTLGLGSTVGGLVGSCGWLTKQKILLHGSVLLIQLYMSHHCEYIISCH